MIVSIKTGPKPLCTFFAILAVVSFVLGWVFGHAGFALMNLVVLSVIGLYVSFILPALFAPYEQAMSKVGSFLDESSPRPTLLIGAIVVGTMIGIINIYEPTPGFSDTFYVQCVFTVCYVISASLVFIGLRRFTQI